MPGIARAVRNISREVTWTGLMMFRLDLQGLGKGFVSVKVK
jgi:hypothetical protein